MRKWIATTIVAAAFIILPYQASANIGDQTLKPSMNHNDVRQLQNLLKVKGYYTYSGSYTTVYDSKTTTAVKKFQNAKKIKASGVSEKATFNALGVYHVNNTNLINAAKKLKGVPYKWGGVTPKGFDCSGFINYVFKTQGIVLPRTAADLYSKVGLKVSQPAVGDLVFFSTYKAGASHVGIYIGNGDFIHASSSKGVTITKLNSSYYAKRFLGAKTL
ncbi:NlpC/P60 family protein [Bacillus sp. CECT 9360]|uniref:C40 family peptidase n=1 Tax=Bacillus sp. CECT 9360 TaxID=2845821 RepID=UPI001EF9BCF8|nr:NlpC/P60 family protein [Bacillus sp. CECT 9360]CAH0345142.1 hypothetical protein BCI9360_01421 [Bacillus sp. CECT 9360]